MNTNIHQSPSTTQKSDPKELNRSQTDPVQPQAQDDKKLVYAKPKKNNLKKFLVGGAFVFVLFLGSIAGLKNLQQQTDNRSQADAATELEIKTEQSYYLGKESSFDIIIKPNGNQIIVTQMRLKFDPTQIEVSSISPGDFFSASNRQVTQLADAIDNKHGSIKFDIHKMPNLTPPPSTTGVLATIKFRPKKTGETKILFSDDTLAGASNEVGSPDQDGINPINPIVNMAPGTINIIEKYLTCGSECNPKIMPGDYGSCGPMDSKEEVKAHLNGICTKSEVNGKYYCANKAHVQTCREYAGDSELAKKYCCGYAVPSINPSKPPQPTTKPELTPTPSPYIEVSLRNEQNSRIVRKVCPVIYLDPVDQKFAVYDTTQCKTSSDLSIPLYTGSSAGVKGAGIRIELNDQDSIINATSNDEANSIKILNNNYYHYVWSRAWRTGPRALNIVINEMRPTSIPVSTIEPTKRPTNTPAPIMTTIPIPTEGKSGPSITKGGGIWDRFIGVIGGLFR